MPEIIVGMLDTKVDGGYIENVDTYREQGWRIINSAHLDKPDQKFDILVTTWTQLSEKRLLNVGCKAIVIRDNDEPDNVINVEVTKKMDIPFFLIDNWGISTRVAWNQKQITEKFINPKAPKLEWASLVITIIGNTPSHDAMAKEWREMGATVYYPFVPKTLNTRDLIIALNQSDVLIAHLGKKDFGKYYLDSLFQFLPKGALFISTTRGPLYSANRLNHQVSERGLIAVLDWAWEEEKLNAHSNLHLTHHQSYKSEQAKNELTAVTVEATHKAIAYLQKTK